MKFTKIRTLAYICFIACSAFAKADIKNLSSLSATKPPNVVMILTDDQGWGDLGFHGNHNIETPQLDKLFRQGVRFDRFYVSPVCSPTRASLLTGRHSLSTGVYSVTRGGEKMQKTEVTIAEILKEHGYATGLFGKWHNGHQFPYDPTGQGFEEFYGFTDGHVTRYFDDTLLHNGKEVKYSGYITDVITDKAIEFIRTNQDKPFFTYISYNAPHSPFELPDQYFKKYKKKGLSDLDASIYGMVENIDDNIARVREDLTKLDLSDDTIIIFLSDNGPAFPNNTPRYNGGMAGKKGKTDEGGVRVPFVLEWSKLKDDWSIPYPAQHIDVLPTLLSLIGIPHRQDNIHGRDLSEFLTQTKPLSHWKDQTLFTHHFHNTRLPNEKSVKLWPGAVRTHRWLASIDHSKQWHLYDLLADPGQKKDVASQYKNVLSTLISDYESWFNDIVEKQGEFTPLPIELGHKESPQVTFPTHEAALENKGVRYAHKDGWAHDWIENIKDKKGLVSWPFEVVAKGKYRFILEYAAPETEVKKGISLSIQEHGSNPIQILASAPELAKYTPQRDDGERKYYTGEAPQLTWKKVVIGESKLEHQQGKLLLSIPAFSGSILVKGIIIEKI